MPERVAEILAGAVQVYLALGLLLAMPFVARGVERIDPLAHGAPWSFRLLIVPGVMIWWPLLLRRWARGVTSPPVETNPHRQLATRPR